MKRSFGGRASESGAPTYTPSAHTFQVAEDIVPIAALKAHLSDVVRSLDSRRPLIVTLNGKPAAVMMSPREFDALSARARVVAKVSAGLADIDAGRVRDADDVFDQLEAELEPAPVRAPAPRRKPKR